MLRIISLLLLVTVLGSGCHRSTEQVWDDTKTAGRYLGQGFRSMGGKHGNSQQFGSRDQFSSNSEEFIPLTNEFDQSNFNTSSRMYRQAKATPGEPGSQFPGVDKFSDPSNDTYLSSVFANIHFAYNSSLVKGDENINIVRGIAEYLNNHPNTAVFVEGHCDERGPQAYNLALGSKRANSVRNLLIKFGVNNDNIFTISYGKERPLVFDHNESSWKRNRRSQFKVYRG